MERSVISQLLLILQGEKYGGKNPSVVCGIVSRGKPQADLNLTGLGELNLFDLAAILLFQSHFALFAYAVVCCTECRPFLEVAVRRGIEVHFPFDRGVA